jgi:acetoin utilization deacetylase AcuC-like enzyme
MIAVYSPKHIYHDPPHEFLDGRYIRFTEAPIRAEMIDKALRASQIAPIIAPDDFGLEPILAVHSVEYVEVLRTIYERWLAEGNNPQAAMPGIMATRTLNRRRSPSPLAEIGYFSMDTSAPVMAGTYQAAVEAAHCALTGAARLVSGERMAYALCRPPGHHATRDLMGGFCYLNNAAIAAHYLTHNRTQRVAILDIDVHDGNGTQAIFYDRADVLFISLHGSPEWEYPYFSGYADERGEGEGEGYTMNFPLEKGLDDVGYLPILDQALAHIRAYNPAYLVLSAGFDAFKDDPLSRLKLTTPCYHEIGKRVAALGLPVLAVQEGGYAVAALGDNVVSLLRGLLEA